MLLLSENFAIALYALRANLTRSFLTVLGIVIGVFSVIMIVAMVTGLKEQIRSQIVSLGADVIDVLPSKVEGAGGFASAETFYATFKKSEVAELKKRLTSYRYLTEAYESAGSFEYQGKSKGGFLLGLLPDYFKIREKKAVAGDLFTNQDARNEEKVAVLGTGIAQSLFGGVERAVGKKIKISGKEFSVIGVLEEETMKFGSFDINDSVYVPAATAESQLPEARLTEVFLKARSEDEVPLLTSEVTRILNDVRGKDNFSIMTQKDMLKVVDQITSLITTALAGLASISLLVGGIGIMNIMLVSVTERTKEIGIRKAVGAENRHILLQFLTEAVVLCLMGGIIGLILVFAVSVGLQKYFGVTSLINAQTVLGAVGFSAFVGILFGTLPAYRASQKDPIESLRYE